MRLTLALTGVAAAAAVAGGLPATSDADLQSRIDVNRSAIGSLRGVVAAESAAVAQTAGGLHAAEAQLSVLQGQLAAHESELVRTRHRLVQARDRLLALENRLEVSSKALSANLIASYEGSRPDLISVILDSHGFGELLERVDFLKRIGHQDATILTTTRAARAAVSQQATALVGLEAKNRTLTDQVLGQRNQAATLQSALLSRQMQQLGARSHDAAKLQALGGQLHRLRAQAAAQARAAAAAAAAASSATSGGRTSGAGPSAPPVGGITVSSGGLAQPSPGAPTAVAQVMAAGNVIASLPYVWGGGHGSFHDSGYDCSGSVSYALAAAGLLSSPLDSTGFESWGDAGPGKWITVYANAGHAFMVIDGWRFDTVALSGGGGTRWTQTMTDTSAYVARHPPGL